jgi:hypothetical protein
LDSALVEGFDNANTPGAAPALSWTGNFGVTGNLWFGLLLSNAVGGGTANLTRWDGAMQLTVEDMGVGVPTTGVINPIPYAGGSPPPPPPTNYAQTFWPTWSETYEHNGAQNITARMYQGSINAAGGSGHYDPQYSFCNWDYADIASKLNGATNVTANLYFYVEHTYNNSGSTLLLLRHQALTGSAPGNLSGITGIVYNQYTVTNCPNPGWFMVVVPANHITDIVNGATTGWGFYADSNNLLYYAYMSGASTPNKPFLNINWTK